MNNDELIELHSKIQEIIRECIGSENAVPPFVIAQEVLRDECPNQFIAERFIHQIVEEEQILNSLAICYVPNLGYFMPETANEFNYFCIDRLKSKRNGIHFAISGIIDSNADHFIRNLTQDSLDI